MKPRTFTVSQVAALTHLTVRALHHYDEIGLLKPSQRSSAGYRLYDGDDLQRLRQVLLFRELGFSLEAVRGLLDATAAQQRDALLAQRAMIEQERRHSEAVLRAVDATLDSLKEQARMNTETLFDGFERFVNGEYAAKPNSAGATPRRGRNHAAACRPSPIRTAPPSKPGRWLSSPIWSPLETRPTRPTAP